MIQFISADSAPGFRIGSGRRLIGVWACFCAGLLAVATTSAAPPPAATPAARAGNIAADKPFDAFVTDQLVPLSRTHEIWIAPRKRRVVVGGQVCLTRGQLEMFACPKGTKEHESVVSLNAKAHQIHAALLAIGARAGQTVRYQPEYRPAAGPEITVLVQWKDADGKRHEVPAQHWIRHVKTGKAMQYEWVFAGSGFWKDDTTGKEHYLAEGGEVICVSNFGTAMLDLPIKSSQDNSGLLFEAFSDRIPPLKTPVRLVLFEKHPADQPDGAAPQQSDVSPSNSTEATQ